MSERRIAGLTGMLFVVMAAIAALAPGEPPDYNDPIEEIVAFVVENDSELVGGAFLQVFALVPALAFFTGLWRVLRRAIGDTWDSATLFYASSVALVTFVAVGSAVGVVPAFQSEQIGAPSADLVRLTWDLNGVMFTLLSLFAFGSVGAAALSVLRTRALPVWLGWLGVLVAIAQVISALGVVTEDLYGEIGFFIGFLPFLVWVVATSVVLLTGPDDAVA